MKDYSCEILIIGAGPSGLSAGIFCGRAERNTIILDGKEPPALTLAKEVYNYPGIERIEGKRLLQNFRNHIKNYKTVRTISGDVIALMVGMGQNMISTRTANITSDAVIIATGRGQKEKKIKGEEGLIGLGVSYCSLCDGPLYKDRVVYVYGSDEEALEDALILNQMGCIVNVITNINIKELPEKVNKVEEKNIKIFDNLRINEIVGNDQGVIQKIICQSTDPEKINDFASFDLDCLFILSHVPSNIIFKKSGIELDGKGNVKVDSEQQTSVKGVFAAGDVTGGLYQVVLAAAEGAKAGINANKYIRELKKI